MKRCHERRSTKVRIPKRPRTSSLATRMVIVFRGRPRLAKPSPEVFCDNKKAWSGDHCIHPDLVPGRSVHEHEVGRAEARKNRRHRTDHARTAWRRETCLYGWTIAAMKNFHHRLKMFDRVLPVGTCARWPPLLNESAHTRCTPSSDDRHGRNGSRAAATVHG